MANKKETPKMNDKKKSPDELVPSEVKAAEEHGPKVSVGNGSSVAREGDLKKPTETPPAVAAGGGEFTVGTWERDKRVNALYNTHHSRNAWMGIAGKGWVQQATTYESSCEAMNILAEHAKLNNSRIDYHVNGRKVTQMYVW